VSGASVDDSASVMSAEMSASYYSASVESEQRKEFNGIVVC
jgi:hypothetical protein